MQNIKMQRNLTSNRITPQGRDPAKYQPWGSWEPPQVHSVGLTPPGLQMIPEWLEVLACVERSKVGAAI